MALVAALARLPHALLFPSDQFVLLVSTPTLTFALPYTIRIPGKFFTP